MADAAEAVGAGASSTAAIRSKTRGALLAGLRIGKLASAVETMETETAASSKFRTRWCTTEQSHGVDVAEEQEGAGLKATQRGDATSVWSSEQLPPTGVHYWECVFEKPEPELPVATWITPEDLRRYVEHRGQDAAKAPPPAPAAACCAAKPPPATPGARVTRQLLRRLGGEWTLKTLTKRLSELADADPSEIEWPPAPERPVLHRGESLGATYFVGVVDRPIGGEKVVRSKPGAWGLSDDKNDGGCHLREDGQASAAVPQQHLNASAVAFGHGEAVGVMVDMDSSPRVLRFYRDGRLLEGVSVSGFPAGVFIAATPRKKGVTVRLGFPGGPKPAAPQAAKAAQAKRKSSKALWKVAATAVEPQLTAAAAAAAAAADRKQTVWKVAQQAVRKMNLAFKLMGFCIQMVDFVFQMRRCGRGVQISN